MPHDDANYKSGKPDAETYKRVQLYLAHLFTSIGGPQIWNGEEMGMWGGDDPEPRKPLWWKGMNFAPETRTNFQPGPKLFDSVGFNQPHFDWYKKLIAIRKANPVLSKGSLTFTTAEGKLLAYKRADQSGEIWVLLNAGKEAGTIPVPAGRYVNLLNDKAVNGVNVQVGPLEAMVLKKN
jgi:glycosidase